MVGLALGIVVIAVAAVIVIVIVALAIRIARQAKTAEEAVEVLRRQTTQLGASRGSTTPACGSSTRRERCERRRSGK